MRSIMEFLVDESMYSINEAFKQQDFARACDLLEKVLRKQGFGIFPGMEEMSFDGKKASCLITVNDATNTIVTINFFNSGDSMSPDAITVIDTDVKKMVADITYGNEKSSVKGFTYDCTGVGITAIINIVGEILSKGASKADEVIASKSEYFTLVESVEEDIIPIDEAFQGCALNKPDIDRALEEMEAAGKENKELSGWCYKMGRLAKDANELEVFEYLRQRRFAYDGKEIKRGAGKSVEDTGATSKPTASIPSAKEMTIRQLKSAQSKATADFWAQKCVRKSAEDRMDMMANQVTTFVNNDDFNLAIFAGAPGVGKTYTAEKELKKLGPGGSTGAKSRWGIIKGTVAPVQFYRMLFFFRNPNNIVLIDDGDAFLDDKEACDIFKAATDSKEFRLISYQKSGGGPAWKMNEQEYWEFDKYCDKLDCNPRVKMKVERSRCLVPPGSKNGRLIEGVYSIPNSFIFQGRIIILTNRGFNEFEPAILDRAEIKANLDFTDEELWDLVKSRAPFIKTKKGYEFSDEVRQYVLDYFGNKISELKVYNDGKEPWEQARISTSLRKFQNACTMVACYWGQPALMEESCQAILASSDTEGYK